ncbi:hypothetical protein [Nostoc punctiforme]|jgi:hypothetical protein|nr:hypothetical protein [Nostoc punctiforme]
MNVDAERLAAGYHRDAENTETGEIEKIFESVLGFFLFGSPCAKLYEERK